MTHVDKFNNNRIRIFLFATGYTVVITAALAAGGYWLDKVLDTKPIIFIIGIVAAYPLTQIILFRKSRKLANNLSKSKQ